MTVVVCCATVGIIVIVNPIVILKTNVIVPINIFCYSLTLSGRAGHSFSLPSQAR